MTGIPHRAVEQLRDAIDMATLIGRYRPDGINGDGKVLCLFHDENTPSMSVDLDRKLFHCFGCDAQGDAITLVEKLESLDFPAAARHLADMFGVNLEDPAADFKPRDRWVVGAGSRPPTTPPARLVAPARWTDVQLARVRELRGWTSDVVHRWGLRVDGDRVAIPVTDPQGNVLGRLRYQPNPELRADKPKMLADKGLPRSLFPPPERVAGEPIWIVEGEPDALTAHSAGLPAVGVPGTQGWDAAWAPRFTGRGVVICTDCDQPGRQLAQAIAADLEPYAKAIWILDLEPGRDDGYDLTDQALHHDGEHGGLRRQLHQRVAELEPTKCADQGALVSGRRLSVQQDVLRAYVRGEQPPEADAIPTPYDELNTVLHGGFRPGQLIVVAGKSGHNKSNLADRLLDTAAAHSRSGHLYMTEMSLLERGQRYLARNGDVPFTRLRRGDLDPVEVQRAEHAIDRMLWPSVLVADWTVQQVCDDILRCGWGMAVVDHLHDFAYRDEADLREHVQAFKRVAKQSTDSGPGSVVVLLSQLNMTQGAAEPGPLSLKGTGAIWQAADEVLFVHMDDDDLGLASTTGRAWTAKGRNNGRGMVRVSLNPERMLLEGESEWKGLASDDDGQVQVGEQDWLAVT